MSNTKARERINNLLDDNSFVEIGALVKARSTDFNVNETETPSDGVVTGYGLINGELVFVYSQDPDVLGGSIGEMHAKKICGLYDLALKTGAPVSGLLDSAGFRLQVSEWVGAGGAPAFCFFFVFMHMFLILAIGISSWLRYLAMVRRATL